MAVRDIVKDERGQATVELAVAFPVLLVVAVIAINALLFFSECATFDRLFRDAVRVHATSPAYGQGVDQSCALVEGTLAQSFQKDYLCIEVTAGGGGLAATTFAGTIAFTPTLFGMGPISEIFGVSLPQLKHTESLTVDAYKPGVFI